MNQKEIECSNQTVTEVTDRQRLPIIELLTEPKKWTARADSAFL